jgi:hypothetical protein
MNRIVFWLFFPLVLMLLLIIGVMIRLSEYRRVKNR